MLDRQLVIGPCDGALQEAPDILNAVRVNVSTNVLFGAVVDDLMLCVVVSNPTVGLPVIGNDDFSIGRSVVLDKVVQGLSIRSVAVPGTGTWTATVQINWAEVAAY